MSELFKTEKFLNVDWLRNATKDGGAQDEVIKLKVSVDDVVLNHVSKKYAKAAEKRMWTSCNSDALLTMINSNNGLYEVIHQFPHKVYFDIDEEIPAGGEATPLDAHIDKINALFPNSDFAVSGSITESKASYHIVLNNYLINSVSDRNTIKIIVDGLGWDNKVYTKNRNMKLPNQSKPDGRIQAIIRNTDIKKHIITAFFDGLNLKYADIDKVECRGDEKLETIKLAIKVEKVKTKPLNIAVMPARAVKEINNLDNFDLHDATPEELLNILPLCENDSHSYTHQCARFCFYNDLTFEQFLEWRRQKRELTESDIKRWSYHWERLNNFPRVSMDTMRYTILNFYPNLISNKHFRKFKKQFDIHGIDDALQKKTEILSQDEFTTDDKYLIVNTQMGSGKTTQSIEYLKSISKEFNIEKRRKIKEIYNDDDDEYSDAYETGSFIWMTPLISLAMNTKHRLNEENIKCKFYKDCKNKSEKEELDRCDELIICINSLLYINKKNYKVVIIDEIETLLNKWFNNKTLDRTKYKCWNNFIRIIRNADKVILLDAFTSKLTTDFIKKVEYEKYPPLLVERNIETSNRQVQFINHFQRWVCEIIEDLKAGKKLFIFYPFKSGQPKKGILSMEGFRNMLENETSKRGKYYHGEIDQVDTMDLYDVNKSWKDVNFIITNTKITVGINYEGKDFDRVYMGIAGMNAARDILQVSYRCRHLNDELIKITFIEKYNTNIDFKNDTLMLESPECTFCPIYCDLVKNILLERYTPLQESILYMCKMAHYNIIESDTFIDENLKDRFKQLVKDNNIIYEYNSIESIEQDVAEDHFKPLTYQGTATQMQQIQLRKFYFDLLWIDDWYSKSQQIEMPDITKLKEMKELAWNKKYFDFMEATNVVVYDKKSNFKKLFDLLKPYFNDSLMPTKEGLHNLVAKK
ncbi:MAG: putative replication origin-binding helicase [Yellowstone Lake virophage 7]|uniref:putative replication origin-binding helicase n=1 Tax=Yellowstone Lake virophage 7 TaxID=1557035 RepID=UPI00053618EC|nr:MAG: putative replication origin-binding helicase [Yellowstone Lake virophage 7]AIW01943.1 MAG: putative replication origin-binding helicase [Yellowstone Lake virophage 7]